VPRKMGQKEGACLNSGTWLDRAMPKARQHETGAIRVERGRAGERSASDAWSCAGSGASRRTLVRSGRAIARAAGGVSAAGIRRGQEGKEAGRINLLLPLAGEREAVGRAGSDWVLGCFRGRSNLGLLPLLLQCAIGSFCRIRGLCQLRANGGDDAADIDFVARCDSGQL